jgi:hypothetical protein
MRVWPCRPDEPTVDTRASWPLRALVRDSMEVKSTSTTLTREGKVALEVERTRTVTLNLPELMIALSTGVPRSPEACGICQSSSTILHSALITYTYNCNVLDSGHVWNQDWMFLQTSGYIRMREREQESYESFKI